MVEEIVRVASCSQEQAEDIYLRWLEKTRKDNRLVIEGIGELVDKSFRMEEEFARTINPKGVRTLVVKRSSHWWVYVIVLICLAVSAGFLYYAYFGGEMATTQATKSEVAVIESADVVGVEKEGVVVEQPDSLSAEAAVEPVVEGVIVEEAVEQTTAVQAESQRYAHYVVYGVYSSEENSVKAVAEVQKKQPGVECVVLPYKNKYMVTIFGSNSAEECQRYLNRSPLGGLWIYKVK